MPKPTIADQLRCIFVYTELPKYYSRAENRSPMKRLIAGIWNVVAFFDPGKVELTAKPVVYTDMDIDMTLTPLRDFLFKLADEGPDVEKEFDGVLWKYVRVRE